MSSVKLILFSGLIFLALHSKAQIQNLAELQSLRSAAIDQGADPSAIDKLFDHYLELKSDLTNNNYVTLIDYNLPSTKKRMFIFNLRDKSVEALLVAHGKATGGNQAHYFSNENSSNMSSLGFFKTGGTYLSEKVGPALKLYGLEKINNRAFERGIVIHGAWYVDEKVIKENGRLGRSLGCPAVDDEIAQEVIGKLKGGSLILAFHDQLETGNFEKPEASKTAIQNTDKVTIDQNK